jgi:hypothetical protein
MPLSASVIRLNELLHRLEDTLLTGREIPSLLGNPEFRVIELGQQACDSSESALEERFRHGHTHSFCRRNDQWEGPNNLLQRAHEPLPTQLPITSSISHETRNKSRFRLCWIMVHSLNSCEQENFSRSVYVSGSESISRSSRRKKYLHHHATSRRKKYLWGFVSSDVFSQ